jgi:hypothetical protein
LQELQEEIKLFKKQLANDDRRYLKECDFWERVIKREAFLPKVEEIRKEGYLLITEYFKDKS